MTLSELAKLIVDGIQEAQLHDHQPLSSYELHDIVLMKLEAWVEINSTINKATLRGVQSYLDEMKQKLWVVESELKELGEGSP